MPYCMLIANLLASSFFGGLMEDLLRVGVITQTHGIKGEVKVFPTTDNPERFRKLKSCIIQGKRQLVPVTVSSVKFFKQYVILKFKEYLNFDILDSRLDEWIRLLKFVPDTY